MADFNSIEEILQLAVQREKEAQKLYSFLAKRVRDDNVAQMMRDLVDEEKEHQRRLEFEMMKEGIVVKDEAADDVKVPENIEKQANIDLAYVEALLLSINKERSAFRTYVDLAATVKNTEFREVLLNLAEQEAAHMIRFEMLYNQAVGKGD